MSRRLVQELARAARAHAYSARLPPPPPAPYRARGFCAGGKEGAKAGGGGLFTARPSTPAPPSSSEPAAEQAAAAAREAEAAAAARFEESFQRQLFPWERAVFGAAGRSNKPLKWWEKGYYAFIALGLTFIVGSKSYQYFYLDPEREAEARREREQRMNPVLIASAAGGDSFIREGKDPFEGMTPEEIQELVEKEAPSGDPYEGLEPHEIQEMVDREARERGGGGA